MEFDNVQWIDLKVEIYDRDLLGVYFRTQSHKTINRHRMAKWKCNMHRKVEEEEDDYCFHTMNVEYREYVSSSCHDNTEGLECPFVYKIIECSILKKVYVFKSLDDHLQGSVEVKETIRGINLYFKNEID